MNPLTQLLREQKEEFEKLAHAYQEVVQPPNCEEFGEGYWEGIKYGQSYLTTAQQQLIDVIIEGMRQAEKPRTTHVCVKGHMFDNCLLDDDDNPICIHEFARVEYNQALQTQITLLEEAKKNI